MIAIGLMSGTSLDGIDVALCEIDGFGYETKVKCIDFIVVDIPKEIKDKIKRACLSEDFTTRDVCSLNFEFGYLLSKAVKEIKDKNNLKDEDIDFISTHGQTIYHLPKPNSNEYASTLQIGEAAVIAYEHKVKVLSNFRVMDVAAKGEGAPLVPHSEKLLYGKKDKCVVLQNIGGIANLTCINDNEIKAFDTGPGNMMIDYAVNKLYSKKYDENGDIAFIGKKIDLMLNELLSHEYLKRIPPKTTGREEFGEQFTKNILEKYKNEKSEDIIHTLTLFTAITITDSYKKFLDVMPDEVILSGGGAYNKALHKMIQDNLSGVKVITQEDLGFSSDAKEAIAFIVLANETLHNRPSNVLNATGAKDEVILGNITPNPFEYLKKEF